MAAGVRRLLGADVGLATTGVAGPDEQEGQPVGTVFLGLALGEHVEAREVRLPGDRNRVRQYSVISVLDLLRRRLLGTDKRRRVGSHSAAIAVSRRPRSQSVT